MSQKIRTDAERDAFLELVEGLLRPFVPAFFAYGVSSHELLQAVRTVYIDGLCQRLTEQERPLSPARIGMLAGITKGEVEALLANARRRQELRAAEMDRIDQLARLLALWNDNPRFSTPYGAPLDLSLQPDGAHRTFDELVKASEVSLSAQAVIQHLTSIGCVTLQGPADRQYARCGARSLTLISKEITRIARLGRVAAACNSTLVHNLLRDEAQDRLFERTLISDAPMPTVMRNEFLAHVKEVGIEFVDELDRWVTTNAEPTEEDTVNESRGGRCGVTLMFFDEHETDPRWRIT